MKRIISYIVLTCLLMSGCGKTKVATVSEYLKWINESENGLVKIKSVNGIELKAKYMPAEYLAYNEISKEPSYTQKQRDSILHLYRDAVSFVFAIGPDTAKGNYKDIMYNSITTYKEYTQRVYDMNFFFGEKVSLSAGNKNYKPVLSAMENIYGLDSKRNIMLVFVPETKEDKNLYTAESLVLKYEDESFALGTNKFIFSRKDLKNIPQFTF